MEEKWLSWTKEMQSLAQEGLAYSKDKFDIDRFQRLRELSVEILHQYTEVEMTKLRDLFANEIGYQTPKIDVRAVIFKGDAILMVEEGGEGKWSLPGGWADIGLSIRDNIIKEAKEEARAIVSPKRIIAVLDWRNLMGKSSPYSIYKIFVQCEYLGGDYEDNIETERAAFFSIDNLPPLSHRNTLEHLNMCFAARCQETIEPYFD